MGESRLIVEELLSVCLQRIAMEDNSINTERELVEVVRNFEAARKRWLHAELELKTYKELLVKSDVSKAALEVKLKHARNQLDVEMKKRFKVEGDYHYLDLDTTLLKPLRSRVREKRRSSMGPVGGASLLKRGRSGGGSAEVLDQQSSKTALDQEVGSIVKASVAPDSGGQILVVGGITQETPTPPFKTITQETPTPPIKTITQETSTPPVRTITQECAVSLEADQTSVWLPGDETVLQPETETAVRPAEKTLKHVFLSKTVIRPETCLPCGKRIRFGKMALKCRNCRSVAHPECRQNLVAGCSGTSMTGSSAQQDSLEGFAPATHPRVPRLIVECVAEIERRGLEERGLYRVPGGERLVKELRDRFLQGKTPLLLGKVQDVHVLCGLLKDFLRRLKEPLLTFRLHRTFMDASELSDEDNSTAIMYQAIAELPKANRETLAFLMLHLYKVTASPRCQMDQNNLARVFGPTIVGHGMAEPSPTTIMRDTNTQPKVICRLLSLPQAFWRRVLSVHNDHISSSNTETYSSQDQRRGQLFKPLTSPEMNSYNKTHVRGSVRQSRNHSNAFTTTTGRTEQGRKFFTSPS